MMKTILVITLAVVAANGVAAMGDDHEDASACLNTDSNYIGGQIHLKAGTSNCFDFQSRVSITGATFDGTCPPSAARSGRAAVDAAAAAAADFKASSSLDLHAAMTKAILADLDTQAALAGTTRKAMFAEARAARKNLPDAERRRADECLFFGIPYDAQVTTVDSCPWLSSVPNCANLTGPGFEINLAGFLDSFMCQVMEFGSGMDEDHNCFKTFQLQMCGTWLDTAAHALKTVEEMAFDEITMELEIVDVCDNTCKDGLEYCYDVLLDDYPATWADFSAEPAVLNPIEDFFCNLFVTTCDRDCDCDEGENVCVIDAASGLSTCVDPCDGPSDCPDSDDTCEIVRHTEFPDYTCSCQAGFSTPHKNKLDYCSMYSGKTCCNDDDDALSSLFVSPCNDPLAEANKDCLALLKIVDCAQCSPYIGEHIYIAEVETSESEDDTEARTRVCESFVDELYQTCHESSICLPGTRCLSTSDCEVMNTYAEDEFSWATLGSFKAWLEQEAGWDIITDDSGDAAACWNAGAAVAPSGALAGFALLAVAATAAVIF